MSKIKKILIAIGTFLAAVFTGFLFGKKSKKDDVKQIEKAEEKKQEAKDEIEKTSAADLVDNGNNAESIRADIEREQQEFRERIRNRFNKDL